MCIFPNLHNSDSSGLRNICEDCRSFLLSKIIKLKRPLASDYRCKYTSMYIIKIKLLIPQISFYWRLYFVSFLLPCLKVKNERLRKYMHYISYAHLSASNNSRTTYRHSQYCILGVLLAFINKLQVFNIRQNNVHFSKDLHAIMRSSWA
jgi:hypothetical protein